MKSKKIGKVNQKLSFFRVRENSQTTTRDEKMFDIFNILKLTKTTLLKLNNNDEYKVMFVNIDALNMKLD